MKVVRTYSLEWLDSLISVTLNPEKPYLQRLNDMEVATLIEKVPIEALQVQLELTSQIFSLHKENQARHMVLKYHAALMALRDAVHVLQGHAGLKGYRLKGLDTLLSTCLDELIRFVEKRFGFYIGFDRPWATPPQMPVTAVAPPVRADPKYKILCTLSADQIALILRAADETQILKARSMNAVFKFIIPFLSTPHKESLSAAAVRSKAYNPEEVDRDAAVDALYRIIKKIQGY
jgi:hypothetical protein